MLTSPGQDVGLQPFDPMRLLSVSATKIGPFSAPFKLEIDPTVTVVTGANDSGKTGVLRAIRLLFSNESVAEKDVNRDHVRATYKPWDVDTGHSLGAEFELLGGADVAGLSDSFAKRKLTGTLTRVLSPKSPTMAVNVSDGGKNHWTQDQGVRIGFPQVVAVGFDEKTETLRPTIPLDAPNSLESAILKVAFGAFNLEKFKAFSPDLWEEQIAAGEEELNRQARRVLPNSDYFRFKLRSVGEGALKLALLLRDAQQAQTPFDFRGAGARKMVSILARLLVEGIGGSHRIVLIDEPENSLHADAQHLLREFLFDLCADGKTQVIYSTHSSCMINPLRPHQVRLLERKRVDGVATTVVVPRPEELGFASVRASWGLTAADSLLYAPVTVIVEGVTEVGCIPTMCARIAKAGIAGFEEHQRLLGLSFFLDGIGQNHRVVAKLAERQGARVVVFLDGDNHAAELEKKLHAEVPRALVVLLPKGKEFEDLVPENRYFEALAAEAELGDAPVLHERYKTWVAEHPESVRYVFSKRVARWLDDSFPEKEAVAGKRKVEIMVKAVDLADPTELGALAGDVLKRLLDAIREQLSKTSFAR